LKNPGGIIPSRGRVATYFAKVSLANAGKAFQVCVGVPEEVKNCIIMHTEGLFLRKLHYNAVFGGGKWQEVLTAETQRALRKD
jgi:hypothetical protein